MERWITKIFAAIASFILPFTSTMLPYKVSTYISSKGARGQRVLSYLICFGGGIFFGTYLLHMGPEVRKLFESYDKHYPVSDLLVGVGFFIVLFVEKIVLRLNKRRAKQMKRASVVQESYCKKLGEVEQMCQECTVGAPCSGEEKFNHSSTVTTESAVYNRGTEIVLAAGDAKVSHGLKADPVEQQSVVLIKADHTDPVEEHDDKGHGHHHNTRSIILILALSLHRIFEGMTIGLQKSVYNVWSLFVAVMCHEVVIGFSLGLQFVKARLTLSRHFVTTLLCSLIMPTGVIVATIMTEVGSKNQYLNITNGVLQAIAMGTFIYVTFFEILQEEIDPEDTSIGKIVCIAAGFLMMALMDLIPEDDSLTNDVLKHESHLSNFTSPLYNASLYMSTPS